MSSWSTCVRLGLASLVLALPASADPVTFALDRVTQHGPDLRPQITLSAEAMPDNTVVFHITNTGTVASSICEVTFDDHGATRALSAPIFVSNGPGTVFAAGVLQAQSPARPGSAPAGVSAFLTPSDPGVMNSGITLNTGMHIRMALLNGKTFDEIVTKMRNGEIRVGLRLDTPGVIDHFVSSGGGVQVAPIPSGALLGATGLTGVLFIGWIRKRRLT